jgi:hypothetical protein
MLYRKDDVYSKNHTRHKHSVEKSVKVLNVKASYAYSNHWALNGASENCPYRRFKVRAFSVAT